MRGACSKPVSSPGRTETYYPPLLMRFLRTNVGSKSRGRSRSSPIFIRRRSSSATAGVETQEPSSPKVTCMGQVRMTRNKNKSDPRKPLKDKRQRSCKWVQNALFCHPFAGKLRARSFAPSWRKWVSFSHVGSSRKAEKRTNSTRSEPIFGRSVQEHEHVEEEGEEERAISFASSSASTPPRNALLLTRCRSAPYRSSSLASRFWGSPLSREGEEKDKENNETEQIENRAENGENPTWKRDFFTGNLRNDGETDGNEDLQEKIDGSSKENEGKGGIFEEGKTEHFGSCRLLILTRCKSEPARIGEKLYPEMGVWKKRRLGFT